MASQFDNDDSQQNGDLCDQTPQWYILKCQVNREDRVKRELDRRIQVAGLGMGPGEKGLVEEVYVPVEKVKEFGKNGKQREVKHKLYPGYIMVKMILNNDTWFLMRETNGVGDFAGTSGRPMPAKEEDVKRLLSTREGAAETAPRVDVPYAVGDRIKIVDGPFIDTEGEVSDVDVVAGTVTVNVKMFGGDTPVNLEYWQVEKANGES